MTIQSASKGTLKVNVMYNEGQIYLGAPLRTTTEKVKTTARVMNATDALVDADYGVIIPVEKKVKEVIPCTKITAAVSPFYHEGAPKTQDGLVQMQLVDFYPNYNLFSMFDVHQPGTMFSFVQPHLRRVYYN